MTHLEFSAKGGKSRSVAKSAASSANLVRARKIKIALLKEKKTCQTP